MIILNISLYNTMALHTHKSNNGEVETSQNMQQTLNTLTTHTHQLTRCCFRGSVKGEVEMHEMEGREH